MDYDAIMTFDAPLAAVKAYIKREQVLGRINPNTAAARQAAVLRILTVLDPNEDTVTFVEDHVDELIERYRRKNPKVGQHSLDTYRGRITRAIHDFKQAQADANWEPPNIPASTATAAMVSEPDLVMRDRDGIRELQTKLRMYGGGTNGLRHRLPLRPDFDVEIFLPRDFSAKEAKRVTTWIAALADFTNEGDR